jgi:hypothetical protein
MDSKELDGLLRDIQELKRSVRKANPFLRDIFAIRAYAILSLPLGVLLLADCMAAHFLTKAAGSFGAIDAAWRTLIIGILIAIAVVGSVMKWIIIGRKAAQIKSGANFGSVVAAVYGGHWFNLSAPLVICMIVTSVFTVAAGHFWLISPVIAIWMGPFCCIISVLLDRKEYVPGGWYMTATGLVGLFLTEGAPFLWLAIVWAGALLVFGIAGLSATKPGREENL